MKNRTIPQIRDYARPIKSHTVKTGAESTLTFTAESPEQWASVTVEIAGGRGAMGGRAFRRFLHSIVSAGVKFTVSNDSLSVTLRGSRCDLDNLLSHPATRAIATRKTNPRQGTGQTPANCIRRKSLPVNTVPGKLPGADCRNEAERERLTEQVAVLANKNRIAHTLSAMFNLPYSEARAHAGL